MYHRNLLAAYKSLVNYSNKQNPLSTEHELMTLCMAQAAIDPSSWRIAPTSGILERMTIVGEREMVDRMEKDLEMFTYGLPPRFSDMAFWYKQVSLFERILD